MNEHKRISPAEREEMQARCDAATAAPWEYTDRPEKRELKIGGRIQMCDEHYYPWAPELEKDWIFIAHARTDVPQLIAENERLRGTLEHYQNEQNWDDLRDEKGNTLAKMILWIRGRTGPHKAQEALTDEPPEETT